ncbi:hypothetical protein PI95_033230, partial [Hassallia byssoidea VB512170]
RQCGEAATSGAVPVERECVSDRRWGTASPVGSWEQIATPYNGGNPQERGGDPSGAPANDWGKERSFSGLLTFKSEDMSGEPLTTGEITG